MSTPTQRTTPIQRVVQVIAVLVTIGTQLIGMWGAANAQLLAQPAAFHGIGWFTVPYARFLLSVTDGGNRFELPIISAYFGIATYWILAFLIIQILGHAREGDRHY